MCSLRRHKSLTSFLMDSSDEEAQLQEQQGHAGEDQNPRRGRLVGVCCLARACRQQGPLRSVPCRLCPCVCGPTAHGVEKQMMNACTTVRTRALHAVLHTRVRADGWMKAQLCVPLHASSLPASSSMHLGALTPCVEVANLGSQSAPCAPVCTTTREQAGFRASDLPKSQTTQARARMHSPSLSLQSRAALRAQLRAAGDS